MGPVSSLHDRACELFYSLVGGVGMSVLLSVSGSTADWDAVDYGAQHSQENGHGQYGRTYETGLFPEWSLDRPLHFLGHSIVGLMAQCDMLSILTTSNQGGPTIIKLQWLLKTGFFGAAYSPDMILSLNTGQSYRSDSTLALLTSHPVSAPFRGTQLVYSLGEDTCDAPAVRRFSPGDMLAKGVHVAAYLAPLLPRFLDLHADARGLSFRHTSFRSFLRQLRRSEWAESRDATPYDVTFDAADERESQREGKVNPRTYYRSYCATLVSYCIGRHRKQQLLTRCGVQDDTEVHPNDETFARRWLSRLVALPMRMSSATIAQFDFSSLRPIPAFMATVAAASRASMKPTSDATIEDGVIDVANGGDYLSMALRANDGVVPLFSQWHPLDCRYVTSVSPLPVQRPTELRRASGAHAAGITATATTSWTAPRKRATRAHRRRGCGMSTIWRIRTTWQSCRSGLGAQARRPFG